LCHHYISIQLLETALRAIYFVNSRYLNLPTFAFKNIHVGIQEPVTFIST